MEKTCEFCGAPRPIVYCQADGAFLCLSCDGKVHSANALSSRHSRSLLCDSCRYNQANVRCLDHLMLLCRKCDARLHMHTPQHKKLMINSFSGCPSAKHFAALWGFNANELDAFSARGQIGSESCLSDDLVKVKFKKLNSTLQSTASDNTADFEIGSNGDHYKTSDQQKEQKNCLIMQQILDLKKLQLTEKDDQSPLVRCYNESDPPVHFGSGMHDEGLGQQLKELDFVSNVPQSLDNSNQGTNGERYSPVMSQLDNFSGSSFVADPFWHSKTPADTSQIWSQNMQDIGVCEELSRFDDFNIPEVDGTFHNFEDLFTGDAGLTQALLEDGDVMWSEIEKATKQDFSAGSSVHVSKEAHSSDRYSNQLSRSFQNSQYLFKSPCTTSFSPSRLSNESSGSECHDSGHSGSFTNDESFHIMADGYRSIADGIDSSLISPKERKKTRMHGKQTQLSPRKAKADMHKRSKSRSFKLEGYISDGVNATKSY